MARIRPGRTHTSISFMVHLTRSCRFYRSIYKYENNKALQILILDSLEVLYRALCASYSCRQLQPPVYASLAFAGVPSSDFPPEHTYKLQLRRILNTLQLFCSLHAKIIPLGHKTADFVALGFQDSDEDEDEDDHEDQTVDTMHYLFLQYLITCDA